MDSIYETVLVLMLTGVSGIIVYAWQENIKREIALAQKRQDLYEVLIRNLVELLVVNDVDERSKRISEIEKCWLFASDNVLRASYNYLEIYDCYWNKQNGKVLEKINSDNDAIDKFGKALAEIFLAMRKDMGHDLKGTAINIDEAKNKVRIYNWGIISKIKKSSESSVNNKYFLSK